MKNPLSIRLGVSCYLAPCGAVSGGPGSLTLWLKSRMNAHFPACMAPELSGKLSSQVDAYTQRAAASSAAQNARAGCTALSQVWASGARARTHRNVVSRSLPSAPKHLGAKNSSRGYPGCPNNPQRQPACFPVAKSSAIQPVADMHEQQERGADKRGRCEPIKDRWNKPRRLANNGTGNRRSPRWCLFDRGAELSGLGAPYCVEL